MYSTKTQLGTLYLHSKAIRLKNSGRLQIIYFFSKQPEGAINIPEGWQVKVTRSGLPVLKKKRTISEEISKGIFG